MYSEQFKESLALVEAAREKNIALEPTRMTAEQKETVLASFHPDYKQDQFSVLTIGPNKGDKVPTELAEILQAHSRINPADIDLSSPDYDVDVLLVYSEGDSIAKIDSAVRRLTADGKTTFAAKDIPAKLRYKEMINLTDMEG